MVIELNSVSTVEKIKIFLNKHAAISVEFIFSAWTCRYNALICFANRFSKHV